MAEQEQIRRIVGRVPAAPGLSEMMTPKDIISILQRHLLLIFTLTTFGLIVGGTGWYLFKQYLPKYTAETYIGVLPPAEKNPTQVGDGGSTPQEEYGHRQTIVRYIKQKSNLLEFLTRDDIKATGWYKKLITDYGQDKGKEKALEDLDKNFRTVAEREASLVKLSMSCGKAKDAADMVNSMIDMFIGSQGSIKRNEIAQKLTTFEIQKNRIQSEILYSEKTMDAIRTQFLVNDLDEHQYIHPIETELTRLEGQHRDLVLAYTQLQEMLKTQEQLATGEVTEQIERITETDTTINMLTQQIAQLETQLTAKQVKFGENHREVQQVKEMIQGAQQEKLVRKAFITNQVRQSNLQQAQQQLVWLAGQLEQIAKQKEEMLKKKENLDLARIEYTKVKTARDERLESLNQIKATIETYRAIHDDPEAPKVQRLDYAVAPIEVSFPKAIVFFPGGFMLGLLFGLGFAFLLELLNDLVRTPRDVDKFLHIPLLGVIPDMQEDVQANEKIDACHVVRQAPYSMVSESYRRFRTNLKLMTSAKDTKVLLISSSMAGEGKTSIAVNLASSFIAENKKVLLIDANFWRPNLNKIFPNPHANSQIENEEDFINQSEFGLSTLLAGLCGYQEVIRPSGIDNLSIIDTGLLPSNPAELLGGQQMEQLLKHQRANYDYIIIDGPPVLLVSDVKTLARLVDGTVLVFNANTTRRGVAIRAIRELNEVKAQILGCALIAVKALKGGYFTEQFKSHQKYQKLQLAQSV